MGTLIRRVKPGDEGDLAYIQTESWKAGQTLLQYKIQRDKSRYLYILSGFQGLTAGMRWGLFLGAN